MGKYTAEKWRNFLDEAEKRTNAEPLRGETETYRENFLDYMRMYEERNRLKLEGYYLLYKTAISQSFFNENYALLSSRSAKRILSRCKVMVLTANPIEKAIFHYIVVDQAKKKNRSAKIGRIICDNTVFFILKWGRYWVAHVHQAETGAYKNMGSNATISDALKYFTPNVIISLGVAFGIDYRTQSIGDVVVSKRILPYSENKRDEDKIKPDRSQDKSIDNWLHVRLINANSFLESITYGDILSGGSVISSFEEKDKICLGYTKADFIIGGEMEGDALFQYSNTDGIPGVVIKGICDWGIAKNDIFPDDPVKEEGFKDSLQAFAMACAVEKSTSLFLDPELFSEPKNTNITFLRKERRINRWCIGLTSATLLVMGIFELTKGHIYWRLNNEAFIPLLLILISIALLYVLVMNAFLWRKKRSSECMVDRELKNAESISGQNWVNERKFDAHQAENNT